MGKKGGSAESVLCLTSRGCYICQVTHSMGRGFLISVQKIFATDGNGLRDIRIEEFTKRTIKRKKVKNILLASDFFSYIPLNVFFLKEENALLSSRLEFESILGSRANSQAVQFFEDSDPGRMHAFFIKKSELFNLSKIFKNSGVSHPEFWVVPPLLVEQIAQNSRDNLVVAAIDNNSLTLVAKKGKEITKKMFLLPVADFTRKLSGINSVKPDEILRLLNGKTPAHNQEIEALIYRFYEWIYRKIEQFEALNFKEVLAEKWVIGGELADSTVFQRLLQNHPNVISFDKFFEKEVSTLVNPEDLRELMPFLPAILQLGKGIFDKKLVHFNENSNSESAGLASLFSYTQMLSIATLLLAGTFCCNQFLSKKVFDTSQAHKQFVQRKEDLEKYTKKIKEIQTKIDAQKTLMDETLCSFVQSKAIFEFFNTVQEILGEMGNTYLSHLKFDVKPKNSNEKSRSPSKKDISNITPESLDVSFSLMGYMFVEDMEKAKETTGIVQKKFNTMFEKFRTLSICRDLRQIKINPPHNHKILFSCVIEIDPHSNIVAL